MVGSESAATKRRSGCGSVRGWPLVSSHFSPGAAPQVGQRTVSIFFRLSCVFKSRCCHEPRAAVAKLDHFRKGTSHSAGSCLFVNGHGPTFQKADDKCAIYLQAAVVADETLLLELIHKSTYPGAGGANHLRQGCLAHLQGSLRL